MPAPMMMIGLIDFPWTKNKRHPGIGRDGVQIMPVGLDFDHLEIGFGNAANVNNNRFPVMASHNDSLAICAGIWHEM